MEHYRFHQLYFNKSRAERIEDTHSAGRLRDHFMYQNFRSQISVVQEGAEQLPRCELFGIHMPTGRLIKHSNTAICNRNTQIRWKRRDVAIEKKCTEATFSLTGEYGAESVKGFDLFKYLGRLLCRLEDRCLVVHRNMCKARQVWGHLVKLPWREWEDLFISSKFYHAVLQAVVLFGADTWVLMSEMSQKLEGVHVEFLRQVTGKKT